MSTILRGLAAAALSASLVLTSAVAFAADPAPTAPPSSEPAPSEPAPSEPAPSEPAPSEPAPSEPAPSEPAPSEKSVQAGPLQTEQARQDRASTLTAPETVEAAADLSDPPAAAAQWLVDQLVDEDHFETSYECGTPEAPATCSFEDYGLTADALLALAAAGGHDEDVDRIRAYLEASSDEYISSFGSTYAGSIAKLLLIAAVTEQDPSSFGGHDLVAELEQRRGTVEAGRYSDAPEEFDYSNTIVQSLAIIALVRSGQTVPSDAVTFLIDQQCADGGFQAQFPADAESCVSDPDSSGFALQALAAAGGTGAAGDAGIAARQWLRDSRLADGHWDAEGTINATALASGGLLVVGDDVTSSVNWLQDAQLDDGSLPINPGGAEGDARATTQAVLSLAGESLLSVGPGGSTRVVLVGTQGVVPDPTTTPGQPAAPVRTPAVSPQADPATTVAANVRAGSGGILPNTGTSPVLPTAVALGLLVLGSLLLVATGRFTGARPPRHRGGVLR